MNKLMRVLSIGWLCGVYSITGMAGTISQVPLFVATQIAPNVFFELDDSGSMDWTILSKKYWSPRTYDPDSGDDENNSADPAGSSNTAAIANGNMFSFGLKP